MKLEAGSPVTIETRGVRIESANLTVLKIVRNRVVLSDSSEWDIRTGRTWASRDAPWPSGRRLRERREGDEEQVEREWMVEQIKKADLAKIPTSELRLWVVAIQRHP